MKTNSQAGFGHVVLLVVLVAVAVVGFAGYRVWSQQGKATVETAASTASLPVKIETKADLTATNKYLDQATSNIDTNLDDSSLDADINSML